MKENKMGVLGCVGLLVGAMIGSAIFSLTGLTIVNAGTSALISWALAAVIMLGYGLITTELATIFPQSGGVFLFPALAFGQEKKHSKLLAWLSAWGFIISNIVALAFSAIYVGIYLKVGFDDLNINSTFIALIAIAFVFILNIIKFSLMGKINNILVVLLAGTLLTFAIVSISSGEWDFDISYIFSDISQDNFSFLTCVPTAMVGYGSIVTVAFVVSEVKNPKRNVPKSAVIAMIIVAFIYLLVILATVGLISSEYLKANPDMQFIPLYAVAFTRLSYIPWLSKLISVCAVLALLTTMLAVMAVTARAIQASSDKDGVLPEKLATKNRFDVPIYATIIPTMVACVLVCFPDTVNGLVELAALFGAITIIVNCLSLIFARKKHIYQPGDFKLFGKSVVPIVIMILIILCYVPDIVKGGIQIWLYTLACYLVGYLIYKAKGIKPKKVKQKSDY